MKKSKKHRDREKRRDEKFRGSIQAAVERAFHNPSEKKDDVDSQKHLDSHSSVMVE